MRRPEWAAAGTFPQAWDALMSDANDVPRTSDRTDLRSHARAALTHMAAARVISIGADQIRALPYLANPDVVRLLGSMRPPFRATYLSVVGALPVFNGGHPTEHELAGTLFVEADPDAGRPSLLVMQFYRIPVMHDRKRPGLFPDYAGAWLSDGRTSLSDASSNLDLAERSIASLYFLESANVELVEARPTRQERRQVERKGGRIALTVAIRQPKKRPRGDHEPEHRDYSHRWEVRGHYKHFPVGTKLADSRPDKLVEHVTLGACRRIWCPPHVKGPQDKPLVPKLRVVATVA